MLYRRPANRSIWSEMERLQREMNRLFSGSGSDWLSWAPDFPAVNIWNDNEGATLTAEIPGIDPEDIEINVVGQTITINGTREQEQIGEGDRYYRQERQQGKFARSFELPFVIDAEKVKATFEKGILYITLPRTEAEKPRKIQVKTS
jgi:HSP20 family protein